MVSRSELWSWLVAQVRSTTGSTPEKTQQLAQLGLDSLEAERLLAGMERDLGLRVESGVWQRVSTFEQLLELLCEEDYAHGHEHRSDFETLMNPHVGGLLRALRLDKEFVRGKGLRLWDHQGGEYLDAIAGYGALPLGHHPDVVWDAIVALRDTQTPNLVQPSILTSAGALARELVALLPHDLSQVTFANSGAEAVEAAIKLARLRTCRIGILSARDSFHGKTLGALSATASEKYQEGCGAPAPGFSVVPFGDVRALRAHLFGGELPAAVILEPIQGEAGAIVPPEGYLREVRALCSERGVLLILDEVQTGFYRTGVRFAFEREGIVPDVLVLAKALGGGMAAIGASIARADVYTAAFGEKHSSTFAGNALAAEAARAAVRVFREEGPRLGHDVTRWGTLLKAELSALAASHPSVIERITGQGLLLGVHLRAGQLPRRSLLRVLAEQGRLAAAFSAHMLNVSRVRVAPALNGGACVRIEPSLTVGEAECDAILNAVERACLAFEKGSGCVIQEILSGKPSSPTVVAAPHVRMEPPRRSEFAFLAHPLSADDYTFFDPTLRELSSEQLAELAESGASALGPFVGGQIQLDLGGREISGDVVVVPLTAEVLAENREGIGARLVDDAADLACRRGARLLGLGAYTSVVTAAGRTLRPPPSSAEDLRITSGNALTVVSALMAVDGFLTKTGRPWSAQTVAIVGAGGSVGAGLVLLTSLRARRILAVLNPQRSADQNRLRLRRVLLAIRRQLTSESFSGPVPVDSVARSIVESDEDRLLECLEASGTLRMALSTAHALPFSDVVFVATSSTNAIVHMHQLKRHAVVVDVSRPRNVDDSARHSRPDVELLDGGMVKVSPRLNLSWLGLKRGQTYACMAETLLLAASPELKPPADAELQLEYLMAVEERARALELEVVDTSETRPQHQHGSVLLASPRNRSE